MSETHEPKTSLPDFPYSHVKVDDVFSWECAECVKVTIHGCEHFLHRTTAFSLYSQLQDYFRNLSDAEKAFLLFGGTELGSELFGD